MRRARAGCSGTFAEIMPPRVSIYFCIKLLCDSIKAKMSGMKNGSLHAPHYSFAGKPRQARHDFPLFFRHVFCYNKQKQEGI